MMAKQQWKPGNMVYPLPAVMVTCGDRNGKKNVMTAAWTGTICSDPAMVYVSMLAESPVCIECKVDKVMELGTHDMFMAKVTAVHADEQYLDKTGRFDLNKAGPLVYSHGFYYGVGKKIGKFGYSVQKKKSKSPIS